MKTPLRIGALTLVVTLLAACGSTPPSRYYMLSADAMKAPTSDGVSVGVGPIQIPDYLKGRGMILGRDGNKLDISEFERWAEPLESGVLRVLLLNLASLLDTRQMTVFPWRADSVPEYGVSIGVVQFAARQDDALLVASWTVTKPRSDTLVKKSLTRHILPLDSNDPNDIADIYSALLLQLSEAIADAIEQDANSD